MRFKFLTRSPEIGKVSTEKTKNSGIVNLEMIKKLLVSLSYREREIIKLLYGIGDSYTYTYEEIGRIFKVSTSTIRRLEKKAIRKIQETAEATELLLTSNEADKDTKIQIELQNVLESIKELSIELLLYLKDQPENLIKLPWNVFEVLVAECLASKGFDEVKLVGKNPKTAADIFAIEKSNRSDSRIRYFIEIKRWKDKVGVEIIDRVYGAIQSEKATWGWHIGRIISLAGFKKMFKYTPRKLELMGIELRNKDDIVTWLDDYRPSDKGLWLPPDFKIMKN